MTPAPIDVISINRLTRRFDDVIALDDVSLGVRAGEFFSLLGPSGCGKTTLLRIIAGLELPDAGTVLIAGADVTSVPAHQRPVNTVFQSYALFPHMNVWDNVAFGLKMKKVNPTDINQKVNAVMELVQISALSRRTPAQLSGGQKQRVALARAIINEPKVLLLDEPLAALDLKLRKQLQVELLNLQKRLGITFIYVTHDQEEALVLSDRIAVMSHGRIEQLGQARELYERPRTRFVSQFLGSCSLIEAKVRKRLPEGAQVETTMGELLLRECNIPREQFTLAIRPEKVQLMRIAPPGQENVVPVQIEQVMYVGSESHYELRSGAQSLRVELMNSGNDVSGSTLFAAGQAAWAFLPPSALVILDD